MIHTLENECLRVTVADAGAELTGVYDKRTGRERLWTSEPSVWNRHAPILFPFVGRVWEKKYRAGGREYPMPTQHGFARDLDFDFVEQTEASVTHRLTSTPWTLERYPYDFILTVRHRLEGNALHVEWTVENPGDGPMFFSIGGHPGFLLPEGSKKEDCFIAFPGAKALAYLHVSPEGYALPEQKTLTLQDGRARYQPDIPDTWIFENHQVRSVAIAGPDGNPYVTLHCEAFPLLAVWANPRGPFICLEPWFGRTDDAGFTGSIGQKKAVQKLEKGERRDIAYSIEFH